MAQKQPYTKPKPGVCRLDVSPEMAQKLHIQKRRQAKSRDIKAICSKGFKLAREQTHEPVEFLFIVEEKSFRKYKYAGNGQMADRFENGDALTTEKPTFKIRYQKDDNKPLMKCDVSEFQKNARKKNPCFTYGRGSKFKPAERQRDVLDTSESNTRGVSGMLTQPDVCTDGDSPKVDTESDALTHLLAPVWNNTPRGGGSSLGIITPDSNTDYILEALSHDVVDTVALGGLSEPTTAHKKPHVKLKPGQTRMNVSPEMAYRNDIQKRRQAKSRDIKAAFSRGFKLVREQIHEPVEFLFIVKETSSSRYKYAGNGGMMENFENGKPLTIGRPRSKKRHLENDKLIMVDNGGFSDVPQLRPCRSPSFNQDSSNSFDETQNQELTAMEVNLQEVHNLLTLPYIYKDEDDSGLAMRQDDVQHFVTPDWNAGSLNSAPGPVSNHSEYTSNSGLDDLVNVVTLTPDRTRLPDGFNESSPAQKQPSTKPKPGVTKLGVTPETAHINDIHKRRQAKSRDIKAVFSKGFKLAREQIHEPVEFLFIIKEKLGLRYKYAGSGEMADRFEEGLPLTTDKPSRKKRYRKDSNTAVVNSGDTSIQLLTRFRTRFFATEARSSREDRQKRQLEVLGMNIQTDRQSLLRLPKSAKRTIGTIRGRCRARRNAKAPSSTRSPLWKGQGRNLEEMEMDIHVPIKTELPDENNSLNLSLQNVYVTDAHVTMNGTDLESPAEVPLKIEPATIAMVTQCEEPDHPITDPTVEGASCQLETTRAYGDSDLSSGVEGVKPTNMAVPVAVYKVIHKH